jgi:hypothetical protein
VVKRKKEESSEEKGKKQKNEQIVVIHDKQKNANFTRTVSSPNNVNTSERAHL